MPYGSNGVAGGALAATGFTVAGWIVGAITLMLVGVTLLMLARRAPAVRP